MDENTKLSESTLNLFSNWNDNNIRYCHWKSNEHLLAGLKGLTDLDILIDPCDADKANEYMIKNNFKRVISHKWKNYSGVEDWVGVDPKTLVQTHLHVHYRLLTGLKNVKEQYFPWAKYVLDNSVKHEYLDIMVCRPEIEIVILIARVAIKKDFLSSIRNIKWGKSERAEFDYLIKRSELNRIREAARMMLSEKCAEECIELVNDIDNTTLLKRFRHDILCDFPLHQKMSRKRASAVFYNRQLMAINGRIKRKELLLYKKMCAVNPDIVVKLEIPVEVSVSRKPCTGRALEQVKQKVEITKKLHYGNAKEYIINPVGNLDDTEREVCNLLWREI